MPAKRAEGIAGIRPGSKIRSSWSEDIRVRGNKVFVSTAIEIEVGATETGTQAMGRLLEGMREAHMTNTEAALEGLQ